MGWNWYAQSRRSSIVQSRPVIGRLGSRRVKQLRQPTVNSPVSLAVVELLLQTVKLLLQRSSNRSSARRQQLIHLLAETTQRLHAESLVWRTRVILHSKRQPAATFDAIMKDTYLING